MMYGHVLPWLAKREVASAALPSDLEMDDPIGGLNWSERAFAWIMQAKLFLSRELGSSKSQGFKGGGNNAPSGHDLDTFLTIKLIFISFSSFKTLSVPTFLGSHRRLVHGHYTTHHARLLACS